MKRYRKTAFVEISFPTGVYAEFSSVSGLQFFKDKLGKID